MPDLQKKACFIIPYFGRLPDTFPIFLRTCAANPDFDWMIVTDDRIEYDYPGNVHRLFYSFEEFAQRVQQHFDFPIALNYPYKICDFRVAFGEIFAEELKEYQFWGHCDLDQYFGKINHFVTDDVLTSYDKILCLGHFTLFRNTPEINQMYLIPDQKRGQSYRDVFSDNRHWIFDEWPSEHTSINHIMKQEQVKTYYCHDCFCDLIPFVSRFQRLIFDDHIEDWKKAPEKNTAFLWENGRMWCCYKETGVIRKQEILYVHIRQRQLLMKEYVPERPVFYIVPNRFVSADEESEKLIKNLLRKANTRGYLFMDELSRKREIGVFYVKAGVKWLKKAIKR